MRLLRLLLISATVLVGFMAADGRASAATLAAAYSVSGQPASLTPGETAPVSLTLTNTGTTTWSASGPTPVHLGIHFARRGGGYGVSGTDATWLTNQRITLPADLAPGASLTLSVSVTAPTTAGSYVLEDQMVQEGVAWFPAYLDSSVSITAPPLAASYAPSGQPGPLTGGQSVSYQVTVTNTGSQTWQAGGANPVHLGIHFASRGGGFPTSYRAGWLTDQRYALPGTVAPGQSVTLTVSVTPPATAGSAVLEYEMVEEGVAWFAQYLDNTVLIAAPNVAASAPGTRTLLWLGGLYPDVMPGQLGQYAREHVAGFLFDHQYQGLHDDFLNGGVGRLPSSSFQALQAQTSQVVSAARSQGVSDIYLRLLADVYAPANPAGQQYKFDIFNNTEVNEFVQSWSNQAAFAAATGMKGIWLDAEPYDYPYAWREEQDQTMSAAGHSPAQVAAQYFTLGQLAEKAVLAKYPTIQIIMSPAFGYSGSGPSSPYEHYADFYAGMVSVAQQMNANGFVLATEASYGQDAAQHTGSLQGIYNFEEGTSPIGLDSAGNPIYSPVRTVLQRYDAQNGTSLWQWHLAHSSVALSTWPYRDQTGITSPSQLVPRFPWDDFAATEEQERSISPKYTWVYAEQAWSWEQPSYSCTYQGQTVTTDLPCPGYVLSQILPTP